MVTTPLRDRMRSILRSRNYSPRTEEAYIHGVAGFARHFGKSPDQLGAAEVIEYQIWLRERKRSASLVNQVVCGLKFFYGEVLGRAEEVQRIPYVRRERRLPVVLSPQQTAKFLASIPPGVHRVLLMTIYATGLRISEALSLQAADIDSQRMVIRVRQGKGRKDRYVPLSPLLLGILRDHWKSQRLSNLLFPSRRDPSKPMNATRIQKYILAAGRRMGMHVTSRTLRHCYATHLIEKGTSPRVVQVLLGHSSVRTTETYMHVSPQTLGRVASPLDEIASLLQPE